MQTEEERSRAKRRSAKERTNRYRAVRLQADKRTRVLLRRGTIAKRFQIFRTTLLPRSRHRSVFSTSAVLARKVDLRMYHAHVPRERIIT